MNEIAIVCDLINFFSGSPKRHNNRKLNVFKLDKYILFQTFK